MKWPLLLVAVLAAAVHTPMCLAENTAVVAIEVKDPTGLVLRGAEVSVASQKQTAKTVLSTDTNGIVTLDLAPGTYELFVKLKAFRTVTKEVKVTNTNRQTFAIVLPVGSCPPGPCLEVMPAYAPATAAHPLLTAGADPRTQSKFYFGITPSHNAIQPGVAVWKKGAPVFFIISMKNNSERVFHFAVTNPAFNYRAIVLDANGKRVPETEAARKLWEKSRKTIFVVSSRSILIELKPREICSDTIEVSYLYDLSSPGEYTIRLERDLPSEVGTGVIASHEVKIAIEE